MKMGNDARWRNDCRERPAEGPKPAFANDRVGGGLLQYKAVREPYCETVTSLTGGNQMNAVELLKEDHQKVHEMFEQVKATESQRQHKQLFKKIKAELDTHTHIEEKVLYPTLKKHDEFKDQVLEAVEEHLQVKTLLGAVDRLSDGNERFDAKLKVLMDNVEHHVEEEEGELFPKVERYFSEEELDELGQRLEAAKKEFGKKPRAKAASSR